MKFVLVTTTINVPGCCETYREARPEVPFIIAGDRQGAARGDRGACEVLGNATYLNPRAQQDLYPGPLRRDRLEHHPAPEHRHPRGGEARAGRDRLDRRRQPPARRTTSPSSRRRSQPHRGYVGAGCLVQHRRVRHGLLHLPRLSLSRPSSRRLTTTVNGDGAEVGIVNGLIYGDPDINAVERIGTTTRRCASTTREAERGDSARPGARPGRRSTPRTRRGGPSSRR